MAAGGESIPRVYTRTGDHGTTGLAGGPRIDKDSDRIRAYGTYDELGGQLGVALADLPPELPEVRSILERLGHELYVAQTELATGFGRKPRHQIEQEHVDRIEKEIDGFQSVLGPLHSFVIPTGARVAAQLHVCRAVARRAETELLRLHRSETQRPALLGEPAERSALRSRAPRESPSRRG